MVQNTFKFLFFSLITLAVMLEVVADVLFKQWTIANTNVLLIVGLILYFAGTLFWAFSLKYGYLSKAISIFTVLNLIIVVLVGALYFGENLTPINKMGIILGIISVILIEL